MLTTFTLTEVIILILVGIGLKPAYRDAQAQTPITTLYNASDLFNRLYVADSTLYFYYLPSDVTLRRANDKGELEAVDLVGGNRDPDGPQYIQYETPSLHKREVYKRDVIIPTGAQPAAPQSDTSSSSSGSATGGISTAGDTTSSSISSGGWTRPELKSHFIPPGSDAVIGYKKRPRPPTPPSTGTTTAQLQDLPSKPVEEVVDVVKEEEVKDRVEYIEGVRIHHAPSRTTTSPPPPPPAHTTDTPTPPLSPVSTSTAQVEYTVITILHPTQGLVLPAGDQTLQLEVTFTSK